MFTVRPNEKDGGGVKKRGGWRTPFSSFGLCSLINALHSENSDETIRFLLQQYPDSPMKYCNFYEVYCLNDGPQAEENECIREFCKIRKSCMLMLQNAFKTECSYVLDAVSKPQDQRLCQISKTDIFIMIWGDSKVKIRSEWWMSQQCFCPDEAEARRVWLNLCKHMNIHILWM